MHFIPLSVFTWGMDFCFLMFVFSCRGRCDFFFFREGGSFEILGEGGDGCGGKEEGGERKVGFS